MKPGLKVTIGVIAGILVCTGLLVIIMFGIAVTRCGKYDKSSREFVDTAVSGIISAWDYAVFCQYSHPDMPSSVSKEWFENRLVSPTEKQLGKFVSCDSSKGEAKISTVNGKTTISGEYTFNMKSDKFELRK